MTRRDVRGSGWAIDLQDPGAEPATLDAAGDDLNVRGQSNHAMTRRISQDEVVRVGRRLKQLRIAARMTQADIAGDAYSHAYVSNVERAKRAPSLTAIDYFAKRLGVPVEAIWDEAGVTWMIEMAKDSAAKGRRKDAVELLLRTLGNLERESDPRPHVMVALHRELAELEGRENPMRARQHLLAAIELTSGDDSLRPERAHLLGQLADLSLREGRADDALTQYQEAVALFARVTAEQARFQAAVASVSTEPPQHEV